MTVTYGGTPQKIESKSTITVSFKPLNTTADYLLIEICFDTIKIKMSMPKMEMNSSKPGNIKSGNPSEIVGCILNRLGTFKLVAKISTSGKFMGFENYKTVKANILEIIDSVPATKKAQVQMMAEGIIKETNLQSMVEPFFAYLPEKAVNNGDKWETSYVQASAQSNMLLSNTFTLNSIENNTAKISGKSEIESMPSNEPAKEGAPQMSTEAKGASTSDLTVYLSTGLISKGSTKSHIEGTMTMKNQGNEMKMPFVIDLQSEINKVE